MFEKNLNSKGHFILSWNGHLLCSKYDPVREAEKWVSSVEDLISKEDFVIVLGLGAGYHIFEMCRRFPNKKIIVLEFNEEIYDFHQKYNAIDLSKCHAIKVRHRNELSKRTVIKKAIRNSYAVIMHPASCKFLFSDYRDLKTFLLGRSLDSVNSIFSIRNDLSHFVNIKKISSRMGENLLSIKDLLNSIDVNENNRELKTLMALNELVK